MQAIARYTLSGPWQAMLVVSLLGVGAWVLFPLMYLSGALMALLAMQLGPGKASQVLFGGLLVQAVTGAVLLASPVAAVSLAALMWVPLVALGSLVWQRGSLPPALTAAALLGLMAVLGFYLLHADPGLWWQARVGEAIDARSSLPDGLATSNQELATLVEGVASYLPGAFAGVWVMGLAASMLLGRWLQSRLYRPGAFGAEFRSWRLATAWTGVTGGCVLVALWRPELAVNLLVPLAVVLCLPALGLLHALLQHRAAARLWLGMLYGALVLLPHLVMVLAAVALVDSWVDFRGRTPTT